MVARRSASCARAAAGPDTAPGLGQTEAAAFEASVVGVRGPELLVTECAVDGTASWGVCREEPAGADAGACPLSSAAPMCRLKGM